MSAYHTILNKEGKTIFKNTNTACFYQVFAESQGYKKLSPGDTFRIFIPVSWLNSLTEKKFKIFLKLMNRWGFKNTYKLHKSIALDHPDWIGGYVNGKDTYTVDLKVDDYKDLQYLKIAGYLVRHTWEGVRLIQYFIENFKAIKKVFPDYDTWQAFVLGHAMAGGCGHGFSFKVADYGYGYGSFILKRVLPIKEHKELFDKQGFSWSDCVSRFSNILGSNIKKINSHRITLEDFQEEIKVEPPKVEAPKAKEWPKVIQKPDIVSKGIKLLDKQIKKKALEGEKAVKIKRKKKIKKPELVANF